MTLTAARALGLAPRTLAAAAVLLVTIAGCGDPRVGEPAAEAPEARPWLVDEAPSRGIDFVLDSGAEGRYLLPEIMSGGVALVDVDGDGDLDAYFVQSGDLFDRSRRGPNRLFENTGGGRFEDVTGRSGTGDTGWGLGVATGDYDGDGWVDLYVTNLGPNVLLRNRGDGSFEDVSRAAGVDDPGFGTSAAFVDVDLDGDLDLFTLNYMEWGLEIERPCFNDLGVRDYCKPAVYQAPAVNRFYRNLGDGRFADASSTAGIAEASGTSMGIVAGDFTGDGWPDVFVANDGMADRLWVGSPEGTFVDEAPLRGCAVDSSGAFKAGMGVDAADLDDDGDLDLIVGNVKGETDSLFVNEGGRFFADATSRYGLAASSRTVTRFGLGFVDFDHDGRLDLFQAAGSVFDADPVLGYGEVNRLLRLTEGGRFVEVPDGIADAPTPQTSRGVAFGDVDADGAIDVVVVNRDAPAELLINRNVGPTLAVRVLTGRGAPALGAVVEADLGDVTRQRTVRATLSYLASCDPVAHYARPPGQRPGAIRVRRPGGGVTSFEAGPARVLVVPVRER